MSTVPFIILAVGLFIAILVDRGLGVREPHVHWMLGVVVGILATWIIFK